MRSRLEAAVVIPATPVKKVTRRSRQRSTKSTETEQVECVGGRAVVPKDTEAGRLP